MVATPTPARSAMSLISAEKPCSAKTAQAASRTRARLATASERRGPAEVVRSVVVFSLPSLPSASIVKSNRNFGSVLATISGSGDAFEPAQVDPVPLRCRHRVHFWSVHGPGGHDGGQRRHPQADGSVRGGRDDGGVDGDGLPAEPGAVHP